MVEWNVAKSLRHWQKTRFACIFNHNLKSATFFLWLFNPRSRNAKNALTYNSWPYIYDDDCWLCCLLRNHGSFNLQYKELSSRVIIIHNKNIHANMCSIPKAWQYMILIILISFLSLSIINKRYWRLLIRFYTCH
jgi:hypothetical protein